MQNDSMIYREFFTPFGRFKVSSLLKIIVFCIITLTALNAQEDEMQFLHLTTEDGLSLNAVTEVLQDSRGFLWFGTYNGLNRYDGYNFKLFLPEVSNPNSISNHSIWALYEDSKGFIWAGTLDGLNRYDWRTEEFQRYKNNPQDTNSLSNNYIYSIFEDKSGTLWVGTLNGLNKYNRNEDNFTVSSKVSNENNVNALNSVTCIEEDYKGNLWLGTWKGLTILSKSGEISYKLLPEDKNLASSFYNEINVIHEDNEKNLWIGTKGKGIYKYNQQSGKFKTYSAETGNPGSLSDNSIHTIYQDTQGNIWIGTQNGLNKFDPERNNFINFFNDPLKPLSINNNEVFSIKEDRTGIVWIGTGGGINRFHQPSNNFMQYQKNNSESSLSNNYVNSVFKDMRGNIWVGTRAGLNKIKWGTKTENNNERLITRYLNNPQSSNTLNDNYVWSLIEDHLGYIWIGTDGGGLNRYNPSTGEFKVYRFVDNDLNSLSNNGVISLCEDEYGNIWVGTWWGFNRFDRKTGKFTRYIDKFQYNTIWKIFEDSKGMLWIGSDGSGVGMYNPNNDTFKNFLQSSSIAGNSGKRVITINESRDGIMWFGTTEGLISYDRIKNNFKTYTKENGLPSILINDVIEDNNGDLWISTDKGLVQFNRQAETFITYTKRDGLKDIEFSPRTSAKTNNGQLIFGCKSGLIFFDPDSIKHEILNSPVVFTDLKIYNRPVPISEKGNSILKESITCAKVLEIPFGNDVITFDFALLDYFNTRSNKFLYKLVGFDSNWNDIGSRNSATYTNLSPGEYTLLVKASNSNFTGNEKTASLKVIIVPTFFQTIWFKIILGLVITIITLLLVQGRTHSIKKRNETLEIKIVEHTKDLDKTIAELSQEVAERKKAESIAQASLKEKEVLLKEIHHRVKNNLQVISSLLYLNSKKIKDEEPLNMFKDSQNRVKSIALVHERLYQSKDLGKIDFRDYVQRLVNDLFRSYAVDPSLIKFQNNINNVSISIDTAVPLGLIINELISNSLKYAFPKENFSDSGNNKTGLIKIDFNHTGDGLILIVSDNGAGLPEEYTEKKKLSLGLQLVDTLVAQLEGKMEIDLNSGTEFKIRIDTV